MTALLEFVSKLNFSSILFIKNDIVRAQLKTGSSLIYYHTILHVHVGPPVAELVIVNCNIVQPK